MPHENPMNTSSASRSQLLVFFFTCFRSAGGSYVDGRSISALQEVPKAMTLTQLTSVTLIVLFLVSPSQSKLCTSFGRGETQLPTSKKGLCLIGL